MSKWIKWLAAVTFCAILAAIFFSIFARGRNEHGPSCLSNLKQIGLAVSQYSQDYDEKMPLISVNAVASSTAPFDKPYGWADAIHLYLKSTQIYQCPSEETLTAGTDGVQSGFTDYWMNANLSGIATKNIAAPSADASFRRRQRRFRWHRCALQSQCAAALLAARRKQSGAASFRQCQLPLRRWPR